MSDQDQFLQMFMEEAEEHIDTLRDGLMSLADDPENLAPVQEMYRAAHTLKGNAGSCGLQKIQNLTHKLENVMSAVRDKEIMASMEVVDAGYDALDRVELLIEYIGEDTEDVPDSEFDVSDLVDKLKSLASGEEGAVKKAEPVYFQLDDDEITELSGINKQNCVLVKIFPDEDCPMPSVRAVIFLEKLADNEITVYKTFPDQEKIEGEEFEDFFMVLCLGEEGFEKQLEEFVEADDDLRQAKIAPLELAEEPLKERVKEAKKEHEPDQTEVKTPKIKKASTIRVQSETLDSLLNILSNLSLQRMKLTNKIDGDSDVERDFLELKRQLTHLQEEVMNTRLLPVNRVFKRFPRLVRDVSKKLGKKIDLEMEGEDTELDKTLVDELGDPLIHIMRNSLDHGIESPEERKNKGKPETGTVYLRAFHEGNNVVIEVEDDGGGIPPDVIIEKAIEKDMISADEAEELTDHEKIQYIMEPGFSTTEEVTDLSGRGVGMDVVRATVEKFRGSMTIESEVDKGTTMRIEFPLTVAIIPALLIRMEKNVLAVPLENIKRTELVGKDNLFREESQKKVEVNGKTYPRVTLNELYTEKENGFFSENERYPMLVVEGNRGTQVGCLCEEIVEQEDIVIKPLGKYLRGLEGYAGATFLADGSATLILDLNEKIQEF